MHIYAKSSIKNIHSSIICNHPKCPSYIYIYICILAVEYYTAMKMSGLQLHPATWENLTNINFKKPSTKECVLYDSPYINFKTRHNLSIMLQVKIGRKKG